MTGTAVSLVLGGGGARGFAHLGVLQAMEELGIAVDMVGGSSIGAIMGIGPGMGWDAAEFRGIASSRFTKLFDYTVPVASVLRGRRITEQLERAIGRVDIADLWVPYFCVSSSLTWATVRYHQDGDLVGAIRSSIAIPGVLPPVPAGDELLVDGGVLDNVPVMEMRRRNPYGIIVAVDVAPADGPRPRRDYGLAVSGWRAWLDRRRQSGPPRLLTTMIRSSLLAAVRDRNRVVDDGVADLYLEVSVRGGGLLDFSAGEEIAADAHRAIRPVLERWLQAGQRRTFEKVEPVAPVTGG